MSFWKRLKSSFWGGTYSGYESAQRNQAKRPVVPMGSPQDQKRDLHPGGRLQMVKRSRYISRNNGYAAEAISTMQLYAVGDGIRAQSLCPDLDARNLYEEYWRDFSRRPELSNRFDMFGLQNLICRAIDVDGEIFAIRTRDRFGNPRVQILESHTIAGITDEERNIWDGIEFDSANRPRWYHMVTKTDRHKSEPETKRIPASAVMHIMEPQTVGAVRGVPTIVGLNSLQDEMELLSDETFAIKQNSKLAMVVTSNRDTALEDGDFGLEIDGYDGEGGGADTQTIADTLGARTVRLNEGESAESFQSNRPNSMFQGHLDHLARNSSGGHLPFEVLRDASKIGGASVRLVTSKVDRRTRLRQNILTHRFLSPCWNYAIAFGIDRGDLPAVPGWSKIKWQTPRRITVDAGREEQAARLAVTTGLDSFSNWHAERGSDFDEWLEMRTTECRKILTASGHDENEPIPLWMLYKPDGAGISIQEEDNTDAS